uniref:Uncharacterized protein n=1 Tax=Vitis vinifera TaxID=29760 RepID=F6HMY8_VITVI
MDHHTYITSYFFHSTCLDLPLTWLGHGFE